MAKNQEFDVNIITKMLTEGSESKALLEDLASSVQKYVNSQQKQLADIQVLLDNARAGKKSKADKIEYPEFKDDKGNLIKGNTTEGKRLRAEWLEKQNKKNNK